MQTRENVGMTYRMPIHALEIQLERRDRFPRLCHCIFDSHSKAVLFKELLAEHVADPSRSMIQRNPKHMTVCRRLKGAETDSRFRDVGLYNSVDPDPVDNFALADKRNAGEFSHSTSATVAAYDILGLHLDELARNVSAACVDLVVITSMAVQLEVHELDGRLHLYSHR